MTKKMTFLLSFGITLLLVTFMVVPVVMSVMAGLTENYFKGISSSLTTRWLQEVWELYHPTIFLSLKIAMFTTLVNVLIGFPCAYYFVRYPSKWTRLFDNILTLPIAIPGIAIALGILSVYASVSSFRGSWLFILVGHIIFTLPFMIKAISSVLSNIPIRTYEEASAALGASLWQNAWHVLIPNCKSGIIAGMLMTMTLSIGEFNLTWMLHTPLTKTLPVGLADAYASMRLEIGSAYTLIFLLMVFPLLVLTQIIGNYSFKKT